MNLSHYVLLKSFFVTATVVWAEIFSEVERVFLRRNISTICIPVLRIWNESVDRYILQLLNCRRCMKIRVQLNKTVGLNLNNMAAAKHSLHYCLLRNNEILSQELKCTFHSYKWMCKLGCFCQHCRWEMSPLYFPLFSLALPSSLFQARAVGTEWSGGLWSFQILVDQLILSKQWRGGRQIMLITLVLAPPPPDFKKFLRPCKLMMLWLSSLLQQKELQRQNDIQQKAKHKSPQLLGSWEEQEKPQLGILLLRDTIFLLTSAFCAGQQKEKRCLLLPLRSLVCRRFLEFMWV